MVDPYLDHNRGDLRRPEPKQHTKRLICACGLRATVTSDSAATVEGITDLVMREHPCRDAAAVPVPDTGDDTLRERLVEVVRREIFRDADRFGSVSFNQQQVAPFKRIADALLPLIRDHVAADSPQRLFGQLISTAKGREILDANGIHGVERAEKAEAQRDTLRTLLAHPSARDLLEHHRHLDSGGCHCLAYTDHGPADMTRTEWIAHVIDDAKTRGMLP